MESGWSESENFWKDSPFLRNAVKFGLGVVVLIFYVTAVLHFGYTPDDTFIYLQFARNIVYGGGFAFNTGEPTYGVTSPLWTLLVAAGGWVRLDLYLVAKVLDLIFASLALIIFYRVGLEVIRDRLLAFLSTFVFSVNVWFVRWAGTGMETSLAVLLTIVTVLYCLKNEYLLAAASCSFLTLVRPEGGLLFLLLLVDIFLNTIEKRRAARIVLRAALIFSVIVFPWLIYAQLAFGTIIPNSMGAKSALDADFGGMTSVALSIGKTVITSNAVELILAVIAVGLMFKKKLFSELREHFLPLAWIVVLPIVYMGSEVGVVSRYLLLVFPLITVYGFLGLKRLTEIFGRIAPYGISIALVLTALILVQNQYVYQKYVKSHMARFSDGVDECLVPIAMWLKENTPTSTVVVAPDVGAIGYWSERKICDIAGLITPEMSRLRREGLTYDEIMKRHLFIPFCYPDYVVDRAQVPERLTDEQFTPLLTRRFNGLGLGKPEVQFFTLYRIIPGITPKAQLTLGKTKL